MTLNQLIKFIQDNFDEEERDKLHVMTDGRDHSYRRAAVEIDDVNYGSEDAPEWNLVIT